MNANAVWRKRQRRKALTARPSPRIQIAAVRAIAAARAGSAAGSFPFGTTTPMSHALSVRSPMKRSPATPRSVK